MQTKTKIENISQSVRETANEPFGFQVKQPPIHSHSAVATGGQGRRAPPNDCLCPPILVYSKQKWSRGHKARGQGEGHKKNPRPRPRTAFPRTDTLEAKDRNARGQGRRTQAHVLSKKKKGLHKNFLGDLQNRKKKGLHKNFSSDLLKKTFSKKFFKRFTKF